MPRIHGLMSEQCFHTVDMAYYRHGVFDINVAGTIDICIFQLLVGEHAVAVYIADNSYRICDIYLSVAVNIADIAVFLSAFRAAFLCLYRIIIYPLYTVKTDLSIPCGKKQRLWHIVQQNADSVFGICAYRPTFQRCNYTGYLVSGFPQRIRDMPSHG